MFTSRTTARFREALAALPPDVQEAARRAYERFRTDPAHPSLRFKRVHEERPIYSARINRGIRALGVVTGDVVVWFWIGAHDDYDRLIASL